MSFDTTKYNNLIARAAFDASFNKGTWQDLSRNKTATITNGPLMWSPISGQPALSMPVGIGVASTAVPAILDVTQSCAIEVLLSRISSISVGYNIRQCNVGPIRGFVSYNSGVSFVFAFYDAAGLYRSYTIAALQSSALYHIVLSCNNVAVTGSGWSNGIPISVTVASAGVIPVNIVGSAIIDLIAFAATQPFRFGLVRLFPFALTNDDATCLYQASRTLTNGDV